MIEAFYLTPEQRDMALDICDTLGLKTNEEFVTVLRVMAEYGKASMTVTPKTKEEYLQHVAKNFKVLKVEPKQ